jgi:phosphoribosylanthranilate isomerase
MVKVKICGITNKEDALSAAESGCDGLGFIFYNKSPRFISPKRAKEIISALPSRVIKIGVFVNSRENTVKKIAKDCSLDMLQFHGQESPEFCQKFKSYKVIKSFRVRGRIRIAEVIKYHTFAYLFDSFSSARLGGTGKVLNWSFVARDLAGIKTPVFLAGGLNDKNVRAALKIVKPDWVDASSRLEIKPGKKDNRKVNRFITRAKIN